MDDTTTDTVTEEPSRYLFDVSFDADQIARAEAEAKAKEEEPPEPTFTLLQIDEARKQGYDEGVLSGQEEASSGIENSIGQTLEKIAEQLPGIIATQSAANEQVMANAAEIAVTIMRKLMPTLLERYGAAEVEALLSESVSNLIDQPKIRVRVASDHAAAIEERLECLVSASGFDGRFLVEPDEAMQPTDCCIDWPGGGIEKRSDDVWAEIDTALARFLAHYGQHKSDPAPAAEDAEQPTTPAAEAGTADDAAAVSSTDTEQLVKPAASHTADVAADASTDSDDVATGGAEVPQDGASPPSDETKAIDPEVPA